MISSELVSFSILSNGVNIDVNNPIVSIETKSQINQITSASICFIEALDIPLESLIEIRAGYDGVETTIFKGKLVNKKVTASSDKGILHFLICSDDSQVNTPIDSSNQSSILTMTYGENIYELDLNHTASGVNGVISFSGSSLAVTGAYLDLAGLGTDYDQKLLISGVKHHIVDGLWTTEVSLGEEIASKNEFINEGENINIADKNGNHIILSANGIEISSCNNIQLKAQGNLNLNGQQISLNADSSLDLSGAELTSVKAGMEIKIQAAMVMIN